MAKSRVVDRDLGWKKFLREMKDVRGAHVKVGVTESVGLKEKKVSQYVPHARFRSAGTPAVKRAPGLTLVQVAFWNEFGTRTIPSRSFIRWTVDKNRKRIRALQRRFGLAIVNGMPVRRALGLLGEFVQGKIIHRINTIRTPANAESTQLRKGQGVRRVNNPLVDVGQLKQSIRWVAIVPRLKGGRPRRAA
jgi:hypothetical protein